METQENKELVERQQRFVNLLEKVYERAIKRKDGSRIRHLVRVVANAYKNNPNELKPSSYDSYQNFPYEDYNEKIAGIASSAYHFLTGDFKAIQFFEYGGLGAIITKSPDELKFSDNQLQFARISGKALSHSVNSGNALQYAETSESALWMSENLENSLQYSKNSGNAFENTQNSGNSLQFSANSGTSLIGSRNSGNALQHSTNSGRSLVISKNSDNVLQYSINSGESFKNSTNSGFALYKSKNSGNALFHSYNHNFALFASENSDKALEDSPLPDYRENLKKSLVRENKGLRYDNMPEHVRVELDKEGGHELALWKLEDLLEKEGRSSYSNPQFFKEGGTRYLFLVDWGRARKKRIIKVDKPLSTLASLRARRDVGERGCGTSNELELISQIEQDGVTQLRDYFEPDITAKYGISGSITIEEYFPDSKSLEELVSSQGPLQGNLLREFVSQAISNVTALYNLGIFHRDLKPSNFLIQQNKGEIRVKITDFANACRTDHPQTKYFPTAGGHLVTDPLLMTPFTEEEARYDLQSEMYSLASSLMFAARGRPIFNYDPDLRSGIAWDTGESILTPDGKLDRNKHKKVLNVAINSLPIESRKILGYLRGLSIDRTERPTSFFYLRDTSYQYDIEYRKILELESEQGD